MNGCVYDLGMGNFRNLFQKAVGFLWGLRSIKKCGRLMTVHERVGPNEELYFHQIQEYTFISHKLFQEENWKKMNFE